MGEAQAWGSHSFSIGEEKSFTLGSLCVTIRRTVTTWQYALSQLPEHVDDQPAEPETTDVEAELDWSTYICGSSDDAITLVPAVPDRPLVIKASQPIHIAPGATYTFFTAIPLWVQAWVGKPGKRMLFDVPTRGFSNTWFGGAMTGRLCYTSSEQVVRHAHDVRTSEGTPSAYCAVEVRNNANTPLNFSKLAVFADLLRIYEVTDTKPDRMQQRKRRATREGIHFSVEVGDLWTSDAFAVYSAEEELNISVSDRPPQIPATVTRLSGPRNPDGDNIIRRGLILLRKISNY